MQTAPTSPANSQAPRLPTPQEIRELKNHFCRRGGDALTVDCAYIAVFDHYVTGSPGYVGKLLSVVWDGSPSFYDVYIWVNGKIEDVEKE